MATAPAITVDDFEGMIAEGQFDGVVRHRVELVHGELLEMSPIGPKHRELTSRIVEWLYTSLPANSFKVHTPGTVVVRPQNSQLEPDVALLKRGDYAVKRPLSDDYLLVIEVSDSSRNFDRGKKADLYASAGITDYWVVDIPRRHVCVYRKPGASGYEEEAIYREGAFVSCLELSQLALDVSKLFQ